MKRGLLPFLWVVLSAFSLLACGGSTDCVDADDDGYGTGEDCQGPDCDDASADVNPGQNEVPYDGVNNDCDETTVDDDLDGDGYLEAVDCDESDPEVHPGAPEVCNDTVDNDCDGQTDAADSACVSCGEHTDCDDLNECTTDFCVQGFCQNDTAPDGLECDDGFFCTVSDACTSGNCLGNTRDCNDGNVCTADSCSEDQARCDHLFQPQPGAEGTSVGDTCQNSADDDCDSLTDTDDPDCRTCSIDDDCDDLNDCTEDGCSGSSCSNTPLADGAACDDGLYCTLGETCLSGMCPPGEVRMCDDGETCTVDGCNEEDNQCDFTWQPRPGEEDLDLPGTCDNASDDDCDALTDGDDPNCWTCTADGECNDDNPCTDDACTDNQCGYQPVAGNPSCDDGLYCTEESTCSQGMCEPVSFVICDDEESCTLDACNEEQARCDNTWEEHPGAESLDAGSTCINQIDDDCDGATDILDMDCWHGLCAVTLDADPPVIPPDGVSTSVITATVTNDAGNSMPDDTQVHFTTTLGTFVETGTFEYLAATVSGAATAALQSELGNPASTTVTASYHCDTLEVIQGTTTVAFQSQGPPTVSLNASSDHVLADEASTVDLVAGVYLSGGAKAGPGEEVIFTTTLGEFVETGNMMFSTVTDGNGDAYATFLGGPTHGQATVAAVAVIDSQLGSDEVTIDVIGLGSIRFVSATPDRLGVRGSGINDSSVVVFEVTDADDQPMPAGVSVDFSHSSAPGVTLDPATGITDAQGMVSTTLLPGTQAATVTVTATVQVGLSNANAVSPSIPIVGAWPSARYITFDCELLNVGGLVLDLIETTCTVSLADRYSNMIGFSTEVHFRTEAGAITGLASTVEDGPDMGTATTAARTQNPRPLDVTPDPGEPFVATSNPRDGLVTLIAVVPGEEEFVDQNGNGNFDNGEPFVDLSEPYLDENDNGQHDASEAFVDGNNSGSYDGPNGAWDFDTLIWTTTWMVWTGGVELGDPATDCTVSPINRYSVLCPPTFDIEPMATEMFFWEIKDINLNPINASCVVDFSVDGRGSAGSSDPQLPFAVPDQLQGNWVNCGGGNCGVFDVNGAENPGMPESGTVTLGVSWQDTPGTGQTHAEYIESDGMFN